MGIRVEMTNRQSTVEIGDHLYTIVRTCIEKTAKSERVDVGEVSVAFVDDEEIRQLNEQYRMIDRPTDVLSFPFADGVLSGEWEPLLGDIVISIPRAVEQARTYGHSLEREVGFLAVHGFLHILGYDHDSDESEREMIQKQNEILHSVGLDRS